MTTIPDLKQREQALNPRQSFIVQAPAGSGKTELLTQRFLVLLSNVKQYPEEILALTFTNKAVSEMRNRIIEALKRGENNTPPTSTHAQKTWNLAQKALARDKKEGWNLLKNPNRLRIQTLDSLCNYLTRQLPLSAQFGAPSKITDDASTLYEEAIGHLMNDLEQPYSWSAPLERLLLHLDNNANLLERLFVNLLKRRDQWLYYLFRESNLTDKRALLEKSLQAIISDHLTYLTKCFPKEMIDDVLRLLRYAAGNKDDISENNHSILAGAELYTLPQTTPDTLPQWLSISALLLKKDGHFRKSVNKTVGFPTDFSNKDEAMLAKAHKKAFQDILESLQAHETFRKSLAELYSLPSPHYADKQWEILSDLITLLPVLAQQLRLVFSRSGEIDYIENSLAAITALSNESGPSDLQLRLDYRIQHLLIDEFQDTSLNQLRLIENITSGWQENEGRTLFIVGDPMQSIYRFREAEVGLFLQVKEKGINQIQPISLTLKANFRSSSNMVNWVNQAFKEAFPSENNSTTGAITYNPATAILDSHTQTDIHIHPFIQAEKFDQAKKIVELIHASDTNADIAILVRTKTQLHDILPALKEANIPYKAIDIETLDTRPAILDLMSLTKSLLNLDDRIAWLSLLRSPCCGLSLEDLLILAHESQKTLWETINSHEHFLQLSDDGQQRINLLSSILKTSFKEQGSMSLRTWIESTWNTLQGPQCYPEINDTSDANTFFELLSTLDEGGNLQDIAQLDKHLIRLFATPQHDPNARVQIMTIHKSKGLEFNTVIIPCLEALSRASEKSLLTWSLQPSSRRGSDLLLAPVRAVGDLDDPIYQYIQTQEQIKLQHEITRLLYVACTRAKTNLHLLANVNLTEKNELKKPPEKSLLATIWKTLKPDFEKQKALTPETSATETDCPLFKESSFKRIPADKLKQIYPSDSSKTAYHAQPSPPTARLIGITTHKILENIANFGITWWKTHPDPTNYIKNLLAQKGLSPSKKEQAFKMVFLAINNTLKDPKGKWILSPHREAQSEYTLSTLIEGKPKDIIIDRTFIDENNQRWIIDYKIIEHATENQENFIEKQKKRYESQLQHYAKALASMSKNPIRVALYFPLQATWCELEKMNEPESV